MSHSTAAADQDLYDVVIIGAGFAGMYLVRKLRDELGFTVKGFERGSDVGGTWYWNRYPGARCDFESDFYSFSFDDEIQQEWDWTERYAAQPEILRYAQFVADKLDVRRSFTFDAAVTRAEFDELTSTWTVETEHGESVRARFVVGATGALSVTLQPHFEGMESFRGDIHHTGAWPHEGVDFTGKRVAVIGTGSSGVQSIPVIAEQAAELTVFQRTATFTFPAANRPQTDRERRQTKAQYAALREAAYNSESGVPVELPMGAHEAMDPLVFRSELERRWRGGGWGVAYSLDDVLTSETANEAVAQFVRDKIHSIVTDPEVAKILEPHDYPVATKRVVLDTDYYETFNRANVRLVSVRDTPIERFTPTGIRVGEREYDFDVIVLATGYDATTGALSAFDVVGRDGTVLRDEWHVLPRAYLGLAVSGFPNLFLITGPGSAAAFTNVIASIEHHVRWIADCLVYCRDHGITSVEADPRDEAEWMDAVAEKAADTLYPRAKSWYMGANVPGKPRVFTAYLGGLPEYMQVCDEIAENGYRGFLLGSADGATALPSAEPAYRS